MLNSEHFSNSGGTTESRLQKIRTRCSYEKGGCGKERRRRRGVEEGKKRKTGERWRGEKRKEREGIEKRGGVEKRKRGISASKMLTLTLPITHITPMPSWS